MKFTFALVLAAATFVVSTTALPQTDQLIPCVDDICLLEPPPCAAGEAPAGGPGCWCGCRPICRQVCPTAASTAVICLADENLTSAPSAIEPCWECCRPICGTTCLPEPILCLETEQLAGTEGCWSCCPIIASA